MNAVEIIRNANAAGITLAAKGDHLSVMPATALSPELRLLLVAHKVELLDYLRQPANDPLQSAGFAVSADALAGRATPPDEPPKGHEPHGTGLDIFGRPLPPARPLVTCGSCQHFEPDAINPIAGAGQCAAGVAHLSVGVSLHPMAYRLCDYHIENSIRGASHE